MVHSNRSCTLQAVKRRTDPLLLFLFFFVYPSVLRQCSARGVCLGCGGDLSVGKWGFCAVLWRPLLRVSGYILYIGISGRCFLCVFFMGSMLSNSKLLLPLHPIRLRLGVGSHRFFEASRKFSTENLVVKFFIPTFVVQNGSKMPM